MKILFTNKFFFNKGGSETVFFHERDYLKNNGHKVIDFSVQDPEIYPPNTPIILFQMLTTMAAVKEKEGLLEKFKHLLD